VIACVTVESAWKASLRRSPVLFHAAKSAQAALTALRRARWTAAREAEVARYLAAHPERRMLQIGTGELPTPGWLNTDFEPRAPGVIFLDAGRRFPLPGATFDAVFSEHVIEHLPFDAGATMLAESRRVLKPGGRIRIATPDLALLARLVAIGAGDAAAAPGSAPGGATTERYLRWIAERFLGAASHATPVHVLNHNVRSWGHVFLYDEPTLRIALERAGFADVRRVPLGRSDLPWLSGLESHGRNMGEEELVAFETMVLEAATRLAAAGAR
jgi:SAM-dependent methyltransferase